MEVLGHKNLSTSLHYFNVSLSSTGQSIGSHLVDISIKQEDIEQRVEK